MNLRDRMRWIVLWEALLVVGSLGAGVILLVPAWTSEVTFFLLAIPSSSFILVFPHEPLLIAYSHIVEPWTLGMLSGAGASIAAAIDYQAFHQVFEARRVQPIKQTRTFRLAVRWFNVAPGLTTWLFFFLPLPDHVIRLMAPAAEYPRWKYVAAVGLGRFPRGVALALVGRELDYPWWAVAVLAVLLLALALVPLLRDLRAKQAASPPPPPG